MFPNCSKSMARTIDGTKQLMFGHFRYGCAADEIVKLECDKMTTLAKNSYKVVILPTIVITILSSEYLPA